MDKGTIVYIGGFELPDKNAAAHRVLANGKIFRELGYRVIFIGINGSVQIDSGLKNEDFFDFECWSITYPKGSIAWLRYILGSSYVLNFINEREQVNKIVGVVCYNYPAIAQLRIKGLCRKYNIKLISDATEWYDASAGSLSYRLVKYVDTTLRMRWVHKVSDGVITTSRYLTDFYNSQKKITVELPTLFDVARFKAPEISKGNSVRRFIYVGSPFDSGRVNKRRTNLKERLDICVDIFYQLHKAGQKFIFDIYGITKDEYLNVFPEHTEMLAEMSGFVSINGRQPNEKVLGHVANADFSIFFRDQNRVTLAGFPSKLAESISIGTPVISNTMVSLRSYEKIEGLFLAKRGEELALVNSLLQLTFNEIDVLKQCAHSSGAFDYRNYSEKVAEFFNKVGV